MGYLTLLYCIVDIYLQDKQEESGGGLIRIWEAKLKNIKPQHYNYGYYRTIVVYILY